MSLFTSLLPSLTRETPARRESEPNVPDLEAAVRPVYSIKESTEAYGVTVLLPGVAKDGLDVSAEDGQLIVVGRRGWKRPDGWTALYRESADVPFRLVLRHDHSVDVNAIHAELREGVLRLSLPKSEAAKPRKIAVN